MANPLRERIARLKSLKKKRLGLRAILSKSNFGKKRIVQSNSFKGSQFAVLKKLFR